MYFQLSKCIFNQQLQYRGSVFFQFIGEFLRIYIELCIWNVLLKYTMDERTFDEMAVYILASEMLSIFFHSNVAMNLSEKVRTGDIAIDLIRPIHLKWYSFWEQISENIFQLLFVGCPNVLIMIAFYPVLVPSAMNVLFFFLSGALAVLLNFYFQYLIGLLTFWFKDGTYARMLINGVMTIFAGRQIPLWFYPGFLYSICRVLPFRFMVYEPVKMLLEQYGGPQILQVLAMQTVWIGFFWILERTVWNKVQRQIEVQGG